MFEKIAEFTGDSDNAPKIRYMGFSMATVGMVVGIGVAIVSGVVASVGLAISASALIVASFLLFPITDINFSKSRGYY